MSITADYENLNVLVSNLKVPKHGSLSDEVKKLEEEKAKLEAILALQEEKAKLEAAVADLRKKIGLETLAVEVSVEQVRVESVRQTETRPVSVEYVRQTEAPKSFSEVAAKVAPQPVEQVRQTEKKDQKNKKQNKKVKSAVSEKHVSQTSEKAVSQKTFKKSTEEDDHLAVIYFERNGETQVLKVELVQLKELLYMTMIDKLQTAIPKQEGGWGKMRTIQGPGYNIGEMKFKLTFYAADHKRNEALGIVEKDGIKTWVFVYYRESGNYHGVTPLTPIEGTPDFKVGEFTEEVQYEDILFPFNYAEFVHGTEFLYGIWESKSVLDMLKDPVKIWDSYAGHPVGHPHPGQ